MSLDLPARGTTAPSVPPVPAPRLLPLRFAALALAWGSSFFLIKVGLEGLTPAQLVLGRLVAGAVALGVVCLATGVRPPRAGRVWVHLLVVAVVLCVVPFLLFAHAEREVSSGLASIENATTPLMTAAVALLALPEERPTRGRLLGLATGFTGVLVVLGPWRGLGGGTWTAELECLAATASYGVAFVYLRRFIAPHRLPAVAVATTQVGLAALVLLLLAPVVALGPVRLTAGVVLAVLALGVLGTGLAYVWNTTVVAAWGATTASSVTYLTPVVGVALGALVLGEPLSWNEPVGALVVVLGIALVQGRTGLLRLPAARRAARC